MPSSQWLGIQADLGMQSDEGSTGYQLKPGMKLNTECKCDEVIGWQGRRGNWVNTVLLELLQVIPMQFSLGQCYPLPKAPQRTHTGTQRCSRMLIGDR